MYTRCPECETTFRLGAEDLRRAHGKVRCGDCGNVFNALEFLAEDADHTDDSLPVLTTGPAVISSADNPHRTDALFEPANETQAPETSEASARESYELEIKSYDEKTGEAWSPLETSTWDSEQIPNVALIDDQNDLEGDAEAEPPAWLADNNASDGLATSVVTEDIYAAQAEESIAATDVTTEPNVGAEEGLPGFYSDDSPFAAEEPTANSPAWQADAYDDLANAEAVQVDAEPAYGTDEASASDSAEEDEPPAAQAEDDLDVEAVPEFDDTVWERIPGVGAAEEQRDTQSDLKSPLVSQLGQEDGRLADGLSYTGTDFLAIDENVLAEPDNEQFDDDSNEQSEDHSDNESNDANTTVEAADSAQPNNDLDFNIPENKWSSFFGDEPAPTASLPATEAEPEAEIAETESIDGSNDGSIDTQTNEQDELEKWPDIPADEDESEASETIEAEAADDAFDDSLTEAEQKLDGTLVGPVSIEFDEPPAPPIGIGEDEDPQSAVDLVAEMAAVFGDTSESLNVTADDMPEADDSVPDTDSDVDVDENEDVDDASDEVAELSEPDDQMDDADGDDEELHWTQMEPTEEVVLSTGEFGAAEIASSLAELKGEADGDTAQKVDMGWRPDHWQPESEDQAANQTGAMPAWKSAYTSAKESRYSKLWLGVILLLVIGFSAQLLHYNRDKLAANPTYGEPTRNFYAQLGAELYPNWSMAGYEIRGSEAIAGESGQDVLDIRTQIASISPTAAGLPQLRVVLRDRWSNPVAARTFTPEEYADGEPLPADGMLQPNQTIAAHVAIVDPGSGAQGFELELCLPRRDTGLECTGQPFK